LRRPTTASDIKKCGIWRQVVAYQATFSNFFDIDLHFQDEYGIFILGLKRQEMARKI
jgi:hypothetical protein